MELIRFIKLPFLLKNNSDVSAWSKGRIVWEYLLNVKDRIVRISALVLEYLLGPFIHEKYVRVDDEDMQILRIKTVMDVPDLIVRKKVDSL